MRFRVQATGWVAEDLRPDWLEAGEGEIGDGATLAEVCAASGLPADTPYMLSVNDTLVNPETRQSQHVSEGDRLVFIAPLSAG